MLAQDIKDAEIVLVGIGSEMQVKLEILKKIPDFYLKFLALEKEQEKQWLLPFLIRYFLKKEFHSEIVKA